MSIYIYGDCKDMEKWLSKNLYTFSVEGGPSNYVMVDNKKIETLKALKLHFNNTLFVFNETYKPFIHNWAHQLTISHEKTHWLESEIELYSDVTQWKTNQLTPIDKYYITNILRLFTQLDVVVGQNYCDQFIPLFKNNEVRNMLCSFACREGTHQRAYALLNDTLGLPDKEYHTFLEYEEMSNKVDFMLDSNLKTREGIALALAKAVFNEGLSLFASFVMLLNFQRFGKMLGMGKIVEWSIRDETIHVKGVSTLFNVFMKSNEDMRDYVNIKIKYMLLNIVRLEELFVDLVYKKVESNQIEGLPKDDLMHFIKYLADKRLRQIGCEPLYNIPRNPLPWVDWIINGSDHTNFFENRVTDYEISGLSGQWNDVYTTKPKKDKTENIFSSFTGFGSGSSEKGFLDNSAVKSRKNDSKPKNRFNFLKKSQDSFITEF